MSLAPSVLLAAALAVGAPALAQVDLPTPEPPPPTFRPYFGGGAGWLAWGGSSPCGCSSLDVRLAAGVRAGARLRLGLRSAYLRTGPTDHFLALGPELGFRLDQAGRFELLGFVDLQATGTGREQNGWGGETRRSGQGYGYELVYRLRGNRDNDRRSPVALRLGWRSMSQATTYGTEGRPYRRERVTHHGWSIGVAIGR